ncbi:XVIPCD domain-containing protein [Xanthomonas sacchari]|uniref:XVIPCD domain-containing protein n=1 Tax=Xanthomonas sacchari TaxID=56458 RepID=UPI0031F2FB39
MDASNRASATACCRRNAPRNCGITHRANRNNNARQPPAADPTRTDHPDHTLLQQIRDKVQGLNGPGQLKPADNDRVSASLYALAKQHHFSSVDQAALSQQTATAAPGEASSSRRFPANDPTKQHAHMSTPPRTKANHKAGCNIDSGFRSADDAVSVFAVETIEP